MRYILDIAKFRNFLKTILLTMAKKNGPGYHGNSDDRQQNWHQLFFSLIKHGRVTKSVVPIICVNMHVTHKLTIRTVPKFENT